MFYIYFAALNHPMVCRKLIQIVLISYITLGLEVLENFSFREKSHLTKLPDFFDRSSFFCFGDPLFCILPPN